MNQAGGLTEYLRILNQIGAAILSEHTPEQIIETVYHHLNKLMDAYSFGIGIYNANSETFDYTGARENDRKAPPFSIDARNTERFSGWVFANKKEVMINDFENEYQKYLPNRITPMQGLQPASLMYVPLLVGEQIIGVLSVRTPLRNAYDDQSLETLKTLAVFISKAIENSKKSPGSKKSIVPKHYYLDPLSARELVVLDLLSKGLTNQAIAQSLFISASTVKTHTLNIYKKLEVANRTEAIVRAKEYGITR
jgi:DNA-binding CsgD family transcriptional regulator/transcriptional regulator with GAF, ATPase, and Fis domain